MAMSFTSLTAAKGTSGALATWVDYTKLDVLVTVDEAQALIYQTLRAREMRVSQQITLGAGASSMPLPTASTGQFLETVTLYDVTGTLRFIPDDARYVSEQRLLQLQQFSGGVLTTGVPSYVAIFGEAYQFDVLSSVQHTFNAVFYQAQALLSNSNQTNFLTTRYPHILRCACMAAAADFMKDEIEYEKGLARLKLLIEAANAEAMLIDQRGLTSPLNKPGVDSSLLSFIPANTVPVKAVLAEAQALIYGRLRAREMRTSTTLTLTAGQSSLALPSANTGQFLEPVALYDATSTISFIPDDEHFVSEQRLLQLQQFTAGVLNTGTPAHVAIFAEAFQFDVKAAANHTFNLVFYQAPTLLTDPSQSNFLTLRYPHILRTAAAVAVADITKDEDGYQKALARLNELIAAANEEARKIDEQGLTSALNKSPVESSLLSFVSNATVPVQAVLAEAQSLIYATLRAREMRTEVAFTLGVGQSETPLPARFLEPMGRIYTTSLNNPIRHKDENFVAQSRNYTESSGTLPAGPFTTTAGSTIVSVNLPSHGFNQDSTFYTTGAVVIAGMSVAIAGTFPIVTIVDVNTFTIDISVLGSTPTASTTGGASACIYTCDNLVQGMANWFAIWDGAVKLDTAASQQMTCRMQYYQSLPILTSPSQSNFLITRYPHLFRAACQVAEANMRRDQAAWQAASQKYGMLVGAVNSENDMGWRGSEIDTITP